MRNIKRIEKIMYSIGKLWTLFPDQRLGQLLYNYGFDCRVNGDDIFNIEDDKLGKELEKNLKEILKPKKK